MTKSKDSESDTFKGDRKVSTKPYAIICDIDNTIALLNGRDPYDTEKCVEDLADDTINTLLLMYNDMDVQIIYVTGREEKWRDATIEWLVRHGFPIDNRLLFMRPTDNHTLTAPELKQIILNNEIIEKYNVIFALEDSFHCAQMYRKNGILCFQVREDPHIK